ncbi:MAG: hypothetical protein ACRDQ5_02885, partial [Sciscionella sp.]
MTARTKSSRDDSPRPKGSSAPAAGLSKLPRHLAVPLVLAGLAALARAVAPLLPITEPEQPEGFDSAPMLVVLAVAPFLLVLAFALRGNGPATARALVAVALFAPGQALTDLQLSHDLSRSTRPDLVLPDSLAPPSAAGGLWLLLAGHLLAALAGVLALVLLREPGGERGDLGASAAGRAAPVHRRQPDGDSLPVAWGRGRIAVLASIGMLAGIALLLSEPFESDNVYLLSGSVLEQPALVFAGGLLLVVAAPVAAVFAAGAETASGCRGGLYGVALGLLSVALPPLVSGLTVDGLHPTWGPVLVVLAAVAVGVLGWLYGRQDPAMDVTRFDGDEPAELRLPDLSRLQVIAGLLGLLAGLSAVAAGLSRQVVFPPWLPQLASYSDRLL